MSMELDSSPMKQGIFLPSVQQEDVESSFRSVSEEDEMEDDEDLLAYDREAGLLTSYSRREAPLTKEEWPPSSSMTSQPSVNRYLKRHDPGS